MKRYLLFLLVALFVQSCAIGQEKEVAVCGPENGSLLIIGGNLSSPAIYAKFLENNQLVMSCSIP